MGASAATQTLLDGQYPMAERAGLMGKYDPLRRLLASRQLHEIVLTFGDVEKLVGPLPPSARIHRAWWANDSKVQAQAWRAAGWHVRRVNQSAGRVTFARGEVGGSRLEHRPPESGR
jgi:hypothetical protein